MTAALPAPLPARVRKGGCRRGLRRAFTLLDLLAVLAVLAISAALLAPALARTKLDSRAFRCLNNTRELTRAWRAYADDHADDLPYADVSTDSSSQARAWVTGTLNFNPANRSNWDPETELAKSPLAPYFATNFARWQCPSDSSVVIVGGVARPRVRSYAMNLFLGGFGGATDGWPQLAPYRLYLKGADLIAPPPAELFVLMDLRADSLGTGSFWTSMTGYAPKTPSAYRFEQLPGAPHDSAGSFTFADGHGELRRWQDRRTTPALVPGGLPNQSITSPGNPDVSWLQDRATRPK